MSSNSKSQSNPHPCKMNPSTIASKIKQSNNSNQQIPADIFQSIIRPIQITPENPEKSQVKYLDRVQNFSADRDKYWSQRTNTPYKAILRNI